MPDLTDADLAELQRLCDAATPGPWEHNRGPMTNGPPDGGGYSYTSGAGGNVWARGRHGGWLAVAPNTLQLGDAALIAAARDALPRLLAEVRRLRAALQSIADDPYLSPEANADHARKALEPPP